ncbi:hypothetical protein INS49_005816 [Diaporthe citri]|uniref:uncharacterized protein n=1 Tax=Diaporthe citri TaxID=83186 RepID=UPI001C7EAE9D|nr:uncharacterized protein INS49_005816 [Diaporthe citri]KAG6364218.1 hypothetical protein INS49_005816 [Diaporthe citri]
MSCSRNNNSTAADINRDRLFATGTFKNVWQGRYIAGARTGEACVAKEFKTSSVFEDHYFQEELNIVDRAQNIIDNWHAANIVNRRIVMSRPQIWQYRRNGRKALVEPFILNFQNILSDPVIMSASYSCGPGDLGPNGIHTFFRRHQCTRFCNSRWIKPRSSAKSAFSKRRGTTMVSRLPTHQTRLSQTRRTR